MKHLKLLSVLLTYPHESWHRDYADMHVYVDQDPGYTRTQKHRLNTFIETLEHEQLLESQERYVATFDKGRALSMLLFEHVHGESRDRGQAMVDLVDVYRKHGFELSSVELPDHLPIFLEFLSTCEAKVSYPWLAEVSHILSLLSVRLSERSSPYADLFQTLFELAGGELVEPELILKVQAETRDDTPEALDKIWEEEAVRFGGDAIMGGVPKPSHGSVDDISSALNLKTVS